MMFLLGALAVFLLLLIYLIPIIKRRNAYKRELDKLPGPPCVPLLGNLMYFLGPQEEIFENIRKIAKDYISVGIARIWIGHLGTANIGFPEDVEKLISTTKHNDKSVMYNLLHCWLGEGLLTSKGAKWQSRRKILTPSFHFNILQDFLPVFIEETENLVEKLLNLKDRDIDVVPYITEFTLNSISETAMGTSLSKLENQNEYKNSVYKMGEFVVYRFTRPWFFYDNIYAMTSGFWKQKKLVNYLHQFSYNVIRDKTKKIEEQMRKKKLNLEPLIEEESYSTRKKRAMLDMLVTSKLQGEPIDDVGIREEVDTFMFEGHDTTSMSICFTLMLLANHKEIQEKVYEEILSVMGTSDDKMTFSQLGELKYLERCIKESLRLYPSVPMISRKTSEPLTVSSGHTIPADTIVNVFIYDMHRLDMLYDDPDRFNPDRFLPDEVQKRHPFAYIPFSAGPRNCIGQKFAIMEIKTVICGILRKFILQQIDTPETIQILVDLVIRPKGSIKIKLIKRETTST